MSGDKFFEHLGRFQAAHPHDYPSWDMADTRGPAVLRVPANENGRDFFVGDLHGMYLLLEECLKAVGFNPEVDRLFSVGDLIDRGPDNIMVLDYLDRPWFFAILGNHDHMMLDAEADDLARSIWMDYNGGEWTRFANSERLQALRDKLKSLPYVLEIDHPDGVIGLVHAEVPIGIDWQGFTARLEQERGGLSPRAAIRSATWGRERFWDMSEGLDMPEIEGIQCVISGHTTVDSVRWSGNAVYIDTGACKAFGAMTVATLDQLMLNR